MKVTMALILAVGALACGAPESTGEAGMEQESGAMADTTAVETPMMESGMEADTSAMMEESEGMEEDSAGAMMEEPE